ncbi:MAG: prepilin-type N-terminal cleavage/methylation domain-containing protein [Gammaproteobacteria bacterium]|nr:prepilin-type N-terminal cleavage/methylation domain-containing protein [Gammaproteobacteria bacterium]
MINRINIIFRSSDEPMLRTRLNTRLKGYSLLELMIAIAIVAVLITLMVPPLFEQIYTARVDATARELSASARLARAEARARNQLVYIGAINSRWEQGWRVWVDNGNEVFDGTGADVLVYEINEAAQSILLTTNESVGAVFRVSNSGYLEAKRADGQWRPREAIFTVCESQYTRRVTVSRRIHTTTEVMPNNTCVQANTPVDPPEDG